MYVYMSIVQLCLSTGTLYTVYCIMYIWPRNQPNTVASAPALTGLGFYAEIQIFFRTMCMCSKPMLNVL